MQEAGELLDLVSIEVEAVGSTLGDGFDMLDIPVVIDAVVKVVKATNDTWKDAAREDKIRIAVDLVDEVDLKYNIVGRAAAAFVGWDIPYAPDGLVDRFLDEDRVSQLLKTGMETLVGKIVDRLLAREIKFGPRAVALIG